MSSPGAPDLTRAEQWISDRWTAASGKARGMWADPPRRRRMLQIAAVTTTALLAVGAVSYVFDWNWFKGPLEQYISARTGRLVRIRGRLSAHVFSLEPSATIGGLEIGNPAWMGKGRTADLGRTTVQIKLLPLLRGRIELPLVRIEHPRADLYRDRAGKENWTLGKPTGKPAALPPIQHFILNDGKVNLVDEQRGLVFKGVVSTSETAGVGGLGAFRLDGEGSLNRAPFVAHITGGPLVHVQRDRPYPFDMDMHAGPNHIVAHGTVTRPFDFGRLRASAQVTGKDLADLYQLTGIVLPNSPAYNLSTAFSRDGQTYVLRHLNGRVGHSDLHGDITVERRGGRRFLQASLASRSLSFADLGAFFGGPQAGKPAAAEAAAVKAGLATGRLLPDAPLDVQRMRAMDADVRYRAASVQARSLPLRQVSLHATLDHGLLRLDPIALTFPSGDVRGRATLDARGDTPKTTVDLAINHVRLQDLTSRGPGPAPLEGLLEGRVRLSGSGDTVHKAAASSNGTIAVAIPPGLMRQSFAELMGVNVVPGLFQLLAKDPKQTDLRCAVADFDVRNGVLTARRLVLDTSVVVATGQGGVNLSSEALDLTLQGHTKKPRLVRVIAPIHVGGNLAKPRLKVDTGPVIAQAGAGLALGAVLTPLAALIPFLSPGGAHDADCAALLAEARSSGAPVRVGAAAALKKR